MFYDSQIHTAMKIMGKKNILEKTCLKYSPLCVQKFSTSRTDCGAISDRNYFVLRFSNTISLKIFRYISGIILISIRKKKSRYNRHI